MFLDELMNWCMDMDMNGCRWTCDGKNEMVAAMLRLCYFFYTTAFSLVLWTAHRCACVCKLLAGGPLS